MAERDVVIVGGGAAGWSAALAQARRRATVVDAGQPRNAPADRVHALLALDLLCPAELPARLREEVLEYDGKILAGDLGREGADR